MAAHYRICFKDNIDKLHLKSDDHFGVIEHLQNNINTKNSLLHHIDPYGDTTFNGIQSKLLLEELSVVNTSIFSNEQRTTFQDLLLFLSRCSDEPHTFVKFLGD